MKIKYFLVMFALSMFVLPSYAADTFQSEVFVLTTKNKEKGGQKGTSNFFASTHYFKPVSTANYPLRLAPIFERSGGFGFGYANSEVEDGSASAELTQGFLMYGHTIIDSPFGFSIGYYSADTASELSYVDIDGDYKSLALGLDYFINPLTAFELALDFSKSEFSGFFDIERKTKSVQLAVTNLRRLSRGDFFALSASVLRSVGSIVHNDDYTVSPNSDTSLEFKGAYYPNKTIGFRAAIDLQISGDGSDDDSLGKKITLYAEKFLTYAFSVELEVSKFKSKNDADSDSESLGLSLAYRF